MFCCTSCIRSYENVLHACMRVKMSHDSHLTHLKLRQEDSTTSMIALAASFSDRLPLNLALTTDHVKSKRARLHFYYFNSSIVLPRKQGNPVSNMSITMATIWSWKGRIARYPLTHSCRNHLLCEWQDIINNIVHVPVWITLLSSHNLQHFFCELQIWLESQITSRRRFKQKPEIYK